MSCFNPAAASMICDERRLGELRAAFHVVQNSSYEQYFRPNRGSDGWNRQPSRQLTRSQIVGLSPELRSKLRRRRKPLPRTLFVKYYLNARVLVKSAQYIIV